MAYSVRAQVCCVALYICKKSHRYSLLLSQGVYKSSLTNFQDTFNKEHFYTDRASWVLQHGIQKTRAFLFMYDIMNKTAQKWSNDSLSGLKT